MAAYYWAEGPPRSPSHRPLSVLAVIVVLPAVAVGVVGTGGFVLASSDLSMSQAPASGSIGFVGCWLIAVVVGAAFLATW